MNLLLIYFIIGILLGIFIGILLCAYAMKKRWLIGNILFQEIEGESQPYLSLDLDKYPQEFKDNKYVLCRVKISKIDVPESKSTQK